MDQVTSLIQNDFNEELKYIIRCKSTLLRVEAYSEYLNKIFHIIAMLLSFSVGYFDILPLAYAAGAANAIALGLKELSTYAERGYIKRTEIINNSRKTIATDAPQIVLAGISDPDNG